MQEGADSVATLRGGDGRCSVPGVFSWAVRPPLECCLVHDLAYERGKCEGAPEAERFVADELGAACVAQETGSYWQAALFEAGVRAGGWWSWHFGECRKGEER